MTAVSYSVDIPAPQATPLINANHRKHYMARARETEAWRAFAGWRIRSAKVPPLPGMVHITCHVHLSTARTYDAGNYYPTAKACVDAATDVGVLPDGDDNAHVTGPDMRQGEPWPYGGITLTFTPREMPA